MQAKRRKNQDQADGGIVIEIRPDGKIVMPRLAVLARIASELGDAKAKESLEQADMTMILLGKRMCG
jgi:hypothetical protein